MKKLLGLLILAGVLLVSCSKEEVQVNSDLGDAKITVNNNADELIKDMIYSNEPLVLKTNGLKASVHMEAVGSYLSPNINGELSSAAFVYVWDFGTPGNTTDDIVYVAYHLRGETYGGAVAAFTFTNPAGAGPDNDPVPISLMTFTKTDFNALTVGTVGAQNYLFIAGSNAAWGATTLRVPLLGTGAINPDYTTYKYVKLASAFGLAIPAQRAASANSVSFTTAGVNSYLFVAAGFTNGGMYWLDASTMIPVVAPNVPFTAMEGAKFTALAPSNPPAVFLLQSKGNNAGKLYKYTIALGGGFTGLPVEITLPSINHQNMAANPGPGTDDYANQGKNTIAINGDLVYVACGKNGMRGFDYTFPAPPTNWPIQSPFDMLSYGNTNGVAISGDNIYMANGADGLSIGKISTWGGVGIAVNIDILAIWDRNIDNLPNQNENASANHVAVANGCIFVAKGKNATTGGLQIIRHTP